VLFVPFCGNLLSVKHDSDSESEVMLCAVKQSRRVVVDLYRPDRDAIARANVDTAAKRTRKSRLGFSETRTRTRGYRNAGKVIEFYAGTSMRYADESVSKWLERPFVRVVFDLHASKEV
jgi:hypothetical protein